MKWMASAAGHDAQVFAPVVRTGMVFIPSIGGISHDFAEDTKEEDIVLGCRVYADAAATFLKDAMKDARASKHTKRSRGVDSTQQATESDPGSLFNYGYINSRL